MLRTPKYPFPVTERVSTQARAVRIEVRPDGEVRLVIPRRVAKRDAYAFVDQRQDWICSKLAELQQRRAEQPRPLLLRWDGQDQLPLRGQPTPLRIIDSASSRPQVRIGEAIVLYRQPGTASATLNRALTESLRELARIEGTRLLDQEAARLGFRFQGPRIGDACTRWGSCTPAGLISLSWRLIMAPAPVFRYVVVHELCHIGHLDHSPRFWGLVERQMPDFREPRSWLRRHGASLHLALPRRSAARDELGDDAPWNQPPDEDEELSDLMLPIGDLFAER